MDGLAFNILIDTDQSKATQAVVSNYIDWIRAHIRVKEVR